MSSTNCVRNGKNFQKLQRKRWCIIMMRLILVLAIYTFVVGSSHSKNNLEKCAHSLNRRNLDIISTDPNDKKDLKVNFYQSSTLFQKQPGRMKLQDTIDKIPKKLLEKSNNNSVSLSGKDMKNVTDNSSIRLIEITHSTNNKTNAINKTMPSTNVIKLESKELIDEVLEYSTENNPIEESSTVLDSLDPNNISSMGLEDTFPNSTPMKLLVPVINDLIGDTSTHSIVPEEEESISNSSVSFSDFINAIVNTTGNSINKNAEDLTNFSLIQTTENPLTINDFDRKNILGKMMEPIEIDSTSIKIIISDINHSKDNSSIELSNPNKVYASNASRLGNLELIKSIAIPPIKEVDHKGETTDRILSTSQPFIVLDDEESDDTKNILEVKNSPRKLANSTKIYQFESKFGRENPLLQNFTLFHPNITHETVAKVTKTNKGTKDLYVCDGFGCSEIPDKNSLGITIQGMIPKVNIPMTSKESLRDRSRVLESTSVKTTFHAEAKPIDHFQALVRSQDNKERQFHNPGQKNIPYPKSEPPSYTKKAFSESSVTNRMYVGKAVSEKKGYRDDTNCLIANQIHTLVKNQQHQGKKLDEILKQQECLNRKLDKIILYDSLRNGSSNAVVEKSTVSAIETSSYNSSLEILSTTEMESTTTEFQELLPIKNDEVPRIQHSYKDSQKMNANANDSYWNSNQTSGYYLSIIKHFDKILNKDPK
ncbi:uncharacterized protein LOC111047580 [Nilaparvata lugens]|uniref:uncharacterized protein LOC111047580 n=1 Tax=Nilaparvata lugens TaxID=108931 RepID=UPI00193EC1A0|nr:uncharacterized protein LOC111047580 [Nilaparvata lugens]